MGEWQDRQWELESGALRPYRIRVPYPIASLPVNLTTQQRRTVDSLEREARDLSAVLETGACDLFLHLSEATGSSRLEGIYPSARRLLRALFLSTSNPTETETLASAAGLSAALKIGADASSLTLEHLQQIQAEIAGGIPEYPTANYRPGEIRTT